MQEEKNWDTSLFLRPTRIANEEEKRLILPLCIQQGLMTTLDSRHAHVHMAQGMESLKPGVRWSVEERRVILNPHLAEEDLLEPNLREVVKTIAVKSLFSDRINNISHCTSV